MQEFKLRFSCDRLPSTDNMVSLADIISPCINSQHNVQVLKSVTNEEIWDAVNRIGALRAPRLDGLSVGFYHECWEKIKD